MVVHQAKRFLEENIKDKYKSLSALLFLGIPHWGSSYAYLGDKIERVVHSVGFDTQGQILHALQLDGEILELESEEFCEAWHEDKFIVRTFLESRGMVGVRGPSRKVYLTPNTELIWQIFTETMCRWCLMHQLCRVITVSRYSILIQIT